MEAKIYEAFAVMPPWGFDDDFEPDHLGWTEEEAWHAFCWPALRREAYEADGFVPVSVILVRLTPPPPRTN